MKRFKQLLEMPQLYTSGILKGKMPGEVLNRKAVNKEPGKKISSLGDYHIFSQYPKDPKNTTIYTKHKTSGEIHMHVDFDGGHVVGLHGSTESTLKAHELYHHLITHHNMELKSDTTQSPGGMKTWKKLKEYPDIKMTHHKADLDKEKRMPLKKKFENNYSSVNRDTYFKAVKK